MSRRPALTITVSLEGAPTYTFSAYSYEDERRLRQWLRRSSALSTAELSLRMILQRLDELDAERACDEEAA